MGSQYGYFYWLPRRPYSLAVLRHDQIIILYTVLEWVLMGRFRSGRVPHDHVITGFDGSWLQSRGLRQHPWIFLLDDITLILLIKNHRNLDYGKFTMLHKEIRRPSSNLIKKRRVFSPLLAAWRRHFTLNVHYRDRSTSRCVRCGSIISAHNTAIS